MDQVQTLLGVGLILTIGFAGYIILEPDSTDGVADWEILDVCLADHGGGISHIHSSLSIIIDGNEIAIPGDIGIQDSDCPDGMRGVHTHHADGTLHIESPGAMDAPVGAFFEIWGENFDETHILNKESNEENEVVMFVNGQENLEFENYVMNDGDVIEIEYRQRQ